MKRIIIIILGLAIAFVVGYYLYCLFFCSTQKNSVKIVFFNYQNDQNYFNKLVDGITSLLDSNSDDIKVDLYMKTGKVISVNILKPDFSSVSVINQIVKDTLTKYLNSNITISNEEANTQIESVLQSIRGTKENELQNIILVGSFPNCYNIDDFNKIKSLFDNKYSNNQIENNRVIWMMKSNNNEPEQTVLSELQKKGINIENQQVSVVKRVCPIIKSNIYSIFFNPLDNDNIKRFESFLKSNYKEDIALTAWNDGKQNIYTFECGLSDKIKEADKEIINKFPKATWTSIGFLLKQASNKFSSMPDSAKKELIIVAPLPLENKGQQMEPTLWTSLSKIKNLTVYYLLPNGCKLNDVDRRIKFGLNNFKIKNQEINL
jgi:hypothetical protein